MNKIKINSLNFGIKSLISETLNMYFRRNLKFYIKEVKKIMTNSKNRAIINEDIYEYNKDDIVNHEDIIEEESKTFYLNNNNYSNKIKANEVKVDMLNQVFKTTNSKFSTSTHNNNLMFMYLKNKTNNLDKIEIFFNGQDKIKEANKEGKK